MRKKKQLMRLFMFCMMLVGITGVPESIQAVDSDFVIEDGVLTKYRGNGSNVTVPDDVASIRATAFDGCKSLTRVDIPSSVVEIESNAFSRCYGLLEINVEARNPSYSSVDGILFDKNKTMLMRCPMGKIGNIAIPAGVTSIEGSAFSGCKKLKKVTIPSSVSEIGGFAFFNCKNLTVISIPSRVASIGGAAFARCENLRELSILNQDTQLGDDVYDDILRSDEEEDNAFKSPVITIKGYAGSAAQQLVNEKIRRGYTQFQFVPLNGTGSKDAAWEIATLLQKAKAPERLSVRKGTSKTIKVTLPKGFMRVTKFSDKNKKGEVKLTFRSTNPDIASVGTKGKVTAKQIGTARIIARLTAHDGKRTQLRVLVTEIVVK